MANPLLNPDEEEDPEVAAERAALEAAIAESLADPRPSIPHAEVRQWLLRLAAGEFGAEPPGGS